MASQKSKPNSFSLITSNTDQFSYSLIIR